MHTVHFDHPQGAVEIFKEGSIHNVVWRLKPVIHVMDTGCRVTKVASCQQKSRQKSLTG